jgi:hypothetical protein
MSNPEYLAVGSAGNRICVFVSYDRESDGDLYDLLAEQASKRSSRFEIAARSSARAPTDTDVALHRAIRESDQVIVICGEHTDCSASVATELRVAQEEQRPYLLLWGRRERMCTKPATAKPSDAIYSWTWEILERQLLDVLRATWSHEQMAELSRRRLAGTAGRSPAPASGATGGADGRHAGGSRGRGV